MKSTFLNVALLSLLVAAVPVSVSSCKDYDDDINQLQQEDAKIKEQLSTLQTALAKAQADADAAKALAQQAYDRGMTAEAVNQVAAQAAAQAKAEAIQEAVAKCEDLLKGYATADELKTLAAKVSAIDEALNKLGNVEEVAQTISALELQVKALEAFKEEIDALGLTDATNGYKALQQLVTTMNSEIQDLLNTVNGSANGAGLKDIVANLSAQVAAINSNLLVLNGQTLYGLVFQPDFYVAGVEAVGAYDYSYNAWTIDVPTTFKGNLADAVSYPTWPQNKSSVATHVIPDLVASYHVNPSTAVLPANNSAYYLNIVDKKYISDPRGAKAQVIKTEAKEGMLDVTARLSEAAIKTLFNGTGDEMTMMQLQVTTASGEKGDTVISSDYAHIFPANYTNLQLAFVEKGAAPHTPLFGTAQEAINAAKADASVCYPIVWNNEEGINIAELVHTEYTLNGKVSDWDKTAASGTVNKSGFAYQFDLVGWANATHGTSESAHAALNEEADSYNVWMRAQMTADGLQQAWGAQQNKATIGRMPLVRVFLNDETSNKHALVGYMIFVITKEEETPEAPAVVTITPNFTDAWTLTCPLQGFDKKVVWFQIEEQILAYLGKTGNGMSKEEFESTYEADYKPGTTEFVQYALNAKGQYEAVKAADYVGSLTYTADAPQEYATNIVEWKISGDKLYQLFVTNEKPVTSLTVVCHFFNRKGGQDLYFSLNYTPEYIKKDIVAELSNDLKISNYWYSKFSNAAGFDEVHMNVQVPGDGNTCEFTTDVLNWFYKDKEFALSGIETVFKGLQDVDLNKYFAFIDQPHTVTGISGSVYEVKAEAFTVGSTTSKLIARRKQGASFSQPTTIATIQYNPITTNGYSTADLKVTYANNGFSKDILSKYNSKLLGENQTLWATLGVSAYGCDDNIPVPVKNNTFNVRFLRPVNMYCKDAKAMYDAGTNGSTVKLIDVLSFADWRYNNAESLFSTHPSYYSYYGFTAVTIGSYAWSETAGDFDVVGKTSGEVQELAKTDLGGTVKNLLDVTDKLKLVYNASSDFSKDLGTITYYNNGETLHTAFHIWLPVVVTYKWGWLMPEDTDMPGYIKLTIDPTIGQN